MNEFNLKVNPSMQMLQGTLPNLTGQASVILEWTKTTLKTLKTEEKKKTI